MRALVRMRSATVAATPTGRTWPIGRPAAAADRATATLASTLNLPRSRSSLLVLVAATALLLAAAPRAAAQTTLSGPAKVADGDTLEIATPDGPARVRLWGVDAPELAQTCQRAGKEWACGSAAKDALVDALGGKEAVKSGGVTCTVKQKDQYGRNVASCAGPAGTDAGQALVKEGLAVEYRTFSGGKYAADEREAKRAKAGMWDGTFQQPAEWRRAKRADELASGKAPRARSDGAAGTAAIATPVLGGGGVVGTAGPAAAPAPAPATPAAKADAHPAGCDIKGNISQRGRKVFHTPDSPAYAQVKVDTAAGERWFCTEAEAEKAGWTKATPGGRPAGTGADRGEPEE